MYQNGDNYVTHQAKAILLNKHPDIRWMSKEHTAFVSPTDEGRLSIDIPCETLTDHLIAHKVIELLGFGDRFPQHLNGIGPVPNQCGNCGCANPVMRQGETFGISLFAKPAALMEETDTQYDQVSGYAWYYSDDGTNYKSSRLRIALDEDYLLRRINLMQSQKRQVA